MNIIFFILEKSVFHRILSENVTVFIPISKQETHKF